MTEDDRSGTAPGGNIQPRWGPFEISSLLDAPAATVWRDATDLAQVNAELSPWLRMTRPRGWDILSPDRIQLGERLFRAWLLFGGILPVDYDDLTIAEIDPGRRFLERSSMLSATLWQHERLIEPLTASVCRLTDRVSFHPRSALHGAVLGWMVPHLFAHRHRRLRHRFARVGAGSSPGCSPMTI